MGLVGSSLIQIQVRSHYELSWVLDANHVRTLIIFILLKSAALLQHLLLLLKVLSVLADFLRDEIWWSLFDIVSRIRLTTIVMKVGNVLLHPAVTIIILILFQCVMVAKSERILARVLWALLVRLKLAQPVVENDRLMCACSTCKCKLRSSQLHQLLMLCSLVHVEDIVWKLIHLSQVTLHVHQRCSITSVLCYGCGGVEDHLGAHGWCVINTIMVLASNESGEILAVSVLAVSFRRWYELVLILLHVPLALGAFILLNLSLVSFIGETERLLVILLGTG